MSDESDNRVIDAEFDLSDVEGAEALEDTDNQTGEQTHTLHPDPEGLLRELAEREEAGDGFPDQMARLMAQPGMQDAVERARWGSTRILNQGQVSALLCMVHREDPTSWIVQALPDLAVPPNPNVRYQLQYGSGGAMRTSGLLPARTWICHGSDVQVVAISQNLGPGTARFAAFITPAPGAIPNIP